MAQEKLTETFQIRLSKSTKRQLLALKKSNKRSMGDILRLMVAQNKRGADGRNSLRKLIQDPSTDDLTKRIAYSMETAISWVIEETVGWDSLDQEALHESRIARTELSTESKK